MAPSRTTSAARANVPALLGARFSNRLTAAVGQLTAGTPLAQHQGDISAALRIGAAGRLFAGTPPQGRAQLGEVVRGAFTVGLNEDLLIAAVLRVVAGVATFLLIRSKDFGGQAPSELQAAPG